MGHKHFEVLALIEVHTQGLGEEEVAPGPALMEVQGAEHIKSARKGNDGLFPPKVAEKSCACRGAAVCAPL